ncbi:hypothetical protein DQW50_15995 [Halorubrum sp. 48-1-W]|uniref:hypothetical protein n=1 Tax=Halorubrum sp. 48-1-W TaxID=2249761 RepID=UPI000DCD783B|nr:hypothetical protein [Halorubrum sp. 48-1-W]RAW44100.1 hypothetical protein DQW50_15995 [Halorubrum sp. 48-1-W]
MALHLSHAVSDGIRRTLTRTGGILFAGLLLVQFATQAAVNTAVLGYLPADVSGQFSANVGITLPVTGPVALALFCVLLPLSAAFFAVVARALARPIEELSTLPADATRRLGRTTVRLFVGGIVVTFLIFLGTAFLVVPGLFFAVSFLFFVFAIAVEDRGLADGLGRSWALARGSRLKLFGIVVLAGVFGGGIGVIAPLFDLAGAPVAGDVVTIVVSVVFFTPYYAVVASAYLQLRDDRGETGHGASGPVDASGTTRL